jgi:hypothetical protein
VNGYDILNGRMTWTKRGRFLQTLFRFQRIHERTHVKHTLANFARCEFTVHCPRHVEWHVSFSTVVLLKNSAGHGDQSEFGEEFFGRNHFEPIRFSVNDDHIIVTLELHQPCLERLTTGLLSCIFDEPDHVFRLVGGQLFPDFSVTPIQNELDFLRFLIDNDVGLHG